ncbi:iron ABC transporter substrate-binding protein [Stappia indica]|nr:iron ABC transporter substrate-binding protein [Stappia indica]
MTRPARFLAAILMAVLIAGAPASARTIVDSAGRTVELPDTVSRVFAAGPPASILVYALKPEALLGWPRALRGEERPYIAEAYRDLPETGRLTGRGGEANLERVLALKPDLIIDFGSVRDTYADLADRVQAQTGIPYILINGRFDETAGSLRLVGEALGVAERGEALARDVEETFAALDAALGAVPEAERPRVYLARGPDGLETGMKGSINTEIIERAGGRNVAEAPGQYGLVQASPEQVILADPDTIITWDPTFFEAVWSSPVWSGITAVRQRRVYLSPTAPFGWIDRPPSLNRMMGLKWLAGLFYPELWTKDLREETRAFYRLWYHVELSDADLDTLLQWANGRAP